MSRLAVDGSADACKGGKVLDERSLFGVEGAQGLFAESKTQFFAPKFDGVAKVLQALLCAVAIVEQLLHPPVIDPDALMLVVSLGRVAEVAIDPFPGSALVSFGDPVFFFPEFRGMR